MAQHTPALRWTEPNPKADAKAVSELVETAEPHRLTGVSIRTLVNGWGAYQDGTRAKYAALIAAAPALLVAASDMMALADTLLTACVGSPVLAVLADKGISQTAIARIHAAGAAIAAAQGEV